MVEAKAQAIEEFRTSDGFEVEVIEGMLQAFGYGFEVYHVQAR